MNAIQLLRPCLCSVYTKRFRNVTTFLLKSSRSQKCLTKFKKYWGGSILLSWSIFSSPPAPVPSEAEQLELKRQELINQADCLFNQNKQRELCKLLNAYKDSTDVELLWRLTRAQYNLAQEVATSPEEKKSLIYEGFGIIARSLALDENHFANHKWMSIMLDARSSYDGIKTRISHLEQVKQHMLIATKLNPKDATTLYMLGLWCYQITDMPWYQRKIASTIFAAPPTSTFEEALKYFIMAEIAEPRFYSKNLLMLGKTYLKLNKEDRARYYLDLACNYPPTTDEDHMANKEACDLLNKIAKKKKNQP